MSKNPKNERIKREYFEYLKHARKKSDATIRQISRSITRFEQFTKCTDFKTFNQKQAVAFKEHMSEQELALATILTTTNHVRSFYSWLSLQTGFKRAIKHADVEYLNLSEKDERAAQAPADKRYPSLEMIEMVVSNMPSETPIEKRDRALVAFLAITGIRDGALATLKLKHFDETRKLVLQNPNDVATKNSKRIDTFLFPLNEKLEQIVLEYINYLRSELFFAAYDPLFPKTKLSQDENLCLKADGLTKEHWKDAAPIRRMVKEAFMQTGIEPFTPHSFRNMIVSEMYRRQLSVSEFKAWSQNLGHEGAMTTLTSYGKIGLEEQGRLVRHAASNENDVNLLAEIRHLLNKNSK